VVLPPDRAHRSSFRGASTRGGEEGFRPRTLDRRRVCDRSVGEGRSSRHSKSNRARPGRPTRRLRGTRGAEDEYGPEHFVRGPPSETPSSILWVSTKSPRRSPITSPPTKRLPPTRTRVSKLESISPSSVNAYRRSTKRKGAAASAIGGVRSGPSGYSGPSLPAPARSATSDAFRSAKSWVRKTLRRGSEDPPRWGSRG
jgi:hypothetical protein